MSNNPDTNTGDKGTLSVLNIQAKIAAEAYRLRQTAYVCQPHEQLLTDLLGHIQEVDFRERAGFAPGDEDAKLKKAHYLIIAAEEVLTLAKNSRWGLCERDGSFYVYNGAFWKAIPEKDLKAFLRKAAEKMGIDKFTARFVEFSDNLFRQFTETAYLPAPIASRESIRINLTNGTFEISTHSQHLRAPDAADFLTHQLPFAYDPKATAPRFQAFLDRVLPDLDCQKVLSEYLGYVFISPSKLKLEKTLLLYGAGANGKSVVFDVIMGLLGSDNVSNYSLSSLTTEPAYCRAHLATKLLNYASEINGKLESDTFKQMVSSEPIEARLPYGQPFILTNYAKLIFNCNLLPTDVEHSHAFFRRFLIVPFEVTIPDHEQDKELAKKIISSELSGVFNWILAGLRRLLEQGRLTNCEAANDQLTAYKSQSDTVRLFMDENQYAPHSEYFTPLKDLYRDYRAYCIESGYRPVNHGNFRKRLTGNGISTERKTAGWVAFLWQANTFQ